MGDVRAMVAAMALLWGCAGAREAAPGPEHGDAAPAGGEARAADALERFVDAEAGFEIGRPAGEAWQFAPGHPAPDGILVPVVVLDAATGSQVVVQVTPAVASPRDFAERLAVGLRSKPGFTTTVRVGSVDGSSSGFSFALGDEVQGRVGITANDEGRLYVLLATWPADVPESVVGDVDRIMRSLRPFAARSAVAK